MGTIIIPAKSPCADEDHSNEYYSLKHRFEHLQFLQKCDCIIGINDMIGKTVVEIYGAEEESDCIIFVCSDGTRYMMYHERDCCEDVSIDDICGSIDCLIGTPLLKAEDVSNIMENAYPSGNDEYGSHTWTFYHLATVKGYVTIRWFGESNGYYSESVDFVRFPDNI